MTTSNRNIVNENRKNELNNNKLLDDLNLTNSQKEILKKDIIVLKDDLEDAGDTNQRLDVRVNQLEHDLHLKDIELQKTQSLYDNLQANSSYIIKEANLTNKDYENLEAEKNFLLEKANKELTMQKLHAQIEILKLESNLAAVQLDLEKERGDDKDTLEYLASHKEEMDKKSQALGEELERFESEFSKYNLGWKSMFESDKDRNKFKEYFTQDNLYKNLAPKSTTLSEIKERWSSHQDLTDRNERFTDNNISEEQVGLNISDDKKSDTFQNENYISIADIKNEQLELELLKST